MVSTLPPDNPDTRLSIYSLFLSHLSPRPSPLPLSLHPRPFKNQTRPSPTKLWFKNRCAHCSFGFFRLWEGGRREEGGNEGEGRRTTEPHRTEQSRTGWARTGRDRTQVRTGEEMRRARGMKNVMFCTLIFELRFDLSLERPRCVLPAFLPHRQQYDQCRFRITQAQLSMKGRM